MFQILVLPSRCRGIETLDLITIPLPVQTVDWDNKYVLTPVSDHTADWSFLVIYPLVNWLGKLGYCKRPVISFRLIYL